MSDPIDCDLDPDYVIDKLDAHIAELEAEIERLRAVVEAALEYDNTLNGLNKANTRKTRGKRHSAEQVLVNEVRKYREALGLEVEDGE